MNKSNKLYTWWKNEINYIHGEKINKLYTWWQKRNKIETHAISANHQLQFNDSHVAYKIFSQFHILFLL